MSNDVTLWNPGQALVIPAAMREPRDIAKYAKQLTPRELKQVIAAFESENFEMGATFVWTKTMAGLKKQLVSLGMEFVGEMLDRPDITQASGPQVLTDHDAIRLAEELGMFGSTQSMRLRRVLEMMSHFSQPLREEDAEEDRQMMPEEAIDCLRTCIQGILGHERLEGAIEFAAFRTELEERTFALEDARIQNLLSSPYFFQRTTIRVLLSLTKTAEGAQLEHALANLNVIVPAIWPSLLKSDRWMIGRAYSEVYNEGLKAATAGIRKALLKVRGFDYVPEDLRLRTFVTAANNLQSVHFAGNNFYNEPAAIKALAALGTVIPMPALATCVTAVLCVRLGNPYGICWAAQETATEMLRGIGEVRWKYYLTERLVADEVILGKLTDHAVAKRWCDLVNEFSLHPLDAKNQGLKRLVESGASGKIDAVQAMAESLLRHLTSR